jgi:hypothetical protein
MCTLKTNNTQERGLKVSFEFQEVQPEILLAKHERIMRIFAEALQRKGKASPRLETHRGHAGR